MALAMWASGPLVNFSAFPAALAEVRRGLRLQWNVTYALMLRETRTRYGDSSLGYGWALIDPLVELVVLWGVFLLVGRHVPVDQPIPVFLITGIFPFSLWRASVGRGASAVSTNLPLLTYPQVTVSDCIVARVLLEAATTFVVMNLFITGLITFYGDTLDTFYDEPLTLFLAFAALLYLSLGSAFLSSGLTRIFPPWPTIFSYLSRPLWITSAIFFTLASLPSNARGYAIYNPLAHMLEWIRSASLPNFESTYYSVTFVLSTATIISFLGLGLNAILQLTGHVDKKG